MSKYQHLYLELELWTLTTGGKQLQLGKPIAIENNKRQEARRAAKQRTNGLYLFRLLDSCQTTIRQYQY